MCRFYRIGPWGGFAPVLKLQLLPSTMGRTCKTFCVIIYSNSVINYSRNSFIRLGIGDNINIKAYSTLSLWQNKLVCFKACPRLEQTRDLLSCFLFIFRHFYVELQRLPEWSRVYPREILSVFFNYCQCQCSPNERLYFYPTLKKYQAILTKFS